MLNIKKPPVATGGFGSLRAQIIFWRKPGYAKITEGVHDLSVDSMNTSFFLVNTEVKLYRGNK
jgi:hypothetical protein